MSHSSLFSFCFSPQIVAARLDGTLEFLTLGTPCRADLTMPLLESSPIKRSSPRTTRKLNTQSGNVSMTPQSRDPASIGVNGSHAYTSPEPPLCRISHKLRAHHQPICVLGIMAGRVITGSHDRTLKVYIPCVALKRWLSLHFWTGKLSAFTL